MRNDGTIQCNFPLVESIPRMISGVNRPSLMHHRIITTGFISCNAGYVQSWTAQAPVIMKRVSLFNLDTFCKVEKINSMIYAIIWQELEWYQEVIAISCRNYKICKCNLRRLNITCSHSDFHKTDRMPLKSMWPPENICYHKILSSMVKMYCHLSNGNP